MRRRSAVLIGATAVAITAGPALAQADAWQHKWYWGAQSGAFFFSTPTTSGQTALSVGGHWLITGRRSALFFSVDQMFFPNTATSQIADGTVTGGFRTVTFESGRRLQASLMAIPSDGRLQFFIGGGIAIHQLTDAAPQGTTDQTIQEAVDERATRAFAVGMAGAQWRIGRSWALYGSAQYMPSSKRFLITSEQFAITGGIRVALGSSNEAVTTER